MIDSIELCHHINSSSSSPSSSSNNTPSSNSIALAPIQFNHNHINEPNSNIKLTSSSSSTSTDTDDAKMILRSSNTVTSMTTTSAIDAQPTSRPTSIYSTYKHTTTTATNNLNSQPATTYTNSSTWMTSSTQVVNPTHANSTLGTTKSVLMNNTGDALATLVKQYGVNKKKKLFLKSYLNILI